MDNTEIRKLHKRDMDKAVETLVRAFKHDPLYEYFIGDAGKRIDFLKKFMRFRLRYGMKYGHVYCTPDVKCVCIWLPPEASMSFWDVISLGGFSAMVKQGSRVMNRVMSYNNFCDGLIAEYAPGSHWKISPIAISPELQGKGYGSMMLRDGMERLNIKHASCVVETQTRENERFYEKHGFKTCTVAHIPQAEPETIIMLRAGK